MLIRVSRFVAALLLLAVLAAACAPASATEPPQSTAAKGGWCAGTKIVFFPGGTPGGGFETVVYNSAVQAAADTGADVEYVWSDWDPAKMTTQFTQAVATKPDGIAIMGHPGDTAFDPLIDDAESQGIIVTSMNTQLPEAQAAYATKGFGYAGAILYQAGHALGAEAVKRSGVKSGDKAFLWGLKAQVEDVLNFARQTGVPFSSRGSAASSLCCSLPGLYQPGPTASKSILQTLSQSCPHHTS